jgi:thymidine phosphorylase
MSHAGGSLKARRAFIDTSQEAVVFMRPDCFVCRSEGLAAQSRVVLEVAGNSIIATLTQVSAEWLKVDEAALSEAAWARLSVGDGQELSIRHADPVLSLSDVRARIYGHRLSEDQLRAIMRDVVRGQYADVHISSLLTACTTLPLDDLETIALTRVMVDVGEKLDWGRTPILDKHCVGGLPGNRTTPIVVAIVAAHGLTIPKTSSRAITSPAGTADTMETMAPVNLDLPAIRRVVEAEGGCIAWGGAVQLSPADDILIRIERALDIDSEGQLVASVISKKVAAGATHLVLDIPIGPTAKVRSNAAALTLEQRLAATAAAFGIQTRVMLTDGTQPVGRGIGPALEARDVLCVLRGTPSAPVDLRERACALAGVLLEMGGVSASGAGSRAAARSLDDGSAFRKFERICEKQGGMRVPPLASQTWEAEAPAAGRVRQVDNRIIARAAKLSGAPEAKAAGLDLHVRVGEWVEKGQPLFTLHAETPGELAYAQEFLAAHPSAVDLELA